MPSYYEYDMNSQKKHHNIDSQSSDIFVTPDFRFTIRSQQQNERAVPLISNQNGVQLKNPSNSHEYFFSLTRIQTMQKK